MTTGDKFVNTTGKDDWMSPEWAYEYAAKIVGVEHFDLDAAALSFSTLCSEWYGPDHPDPDRRDALAVEWPPVFVWCNPPYSKRGGGLFKWCEAFVKAKDRGATVAALFFARTDTKAWHEFVTRASEVHLFKGRLKFLDPDTGEPTANCAPAPSCLVIWTPGEDGPPRYIHTEKKR